MPEFLHIGWEELERICSEVANKAREFHPDAIIGISRGGLVPARLIADELGVHEIAVMRIEFYKSIGKTHDFPRITQPLNADVKGKKVLIVDDVSDTGRSLMVARDHVKRAGASEIRIATLHMKPGTTFKPDYYSGETGKWIAYPWEKKELAREMEGKC
ncbi:MAG: phosphoribosyltransferase [Candidatus Bilamarchaeaceae archaeon]